MLKTIIILILIVLKSFLINAQEQFESKADSLKKSLNYDVYIKYLYDFNSKKNKSLDDQIKLNINFLEYYRLFDFKPDSIKKYYNSGKRLALQGAKKEYLANIEFMWASYLTHIGNYKESLEVLNNIRQEVEKNKYFFLPHLYDAFAELHFCLGNFEKSLTFLKMEADTYQNQSNLFNYAVSLNNIGVIYQSKNNSDSSLFYHNKALKIRLEIKDTTFIISSYNNIGRVHYEMKKLDIAKKYYEKALEFEISQYNHELMINYSDLLIELEEYSKAEKILQSQLQLVNKLILKKNIFNGLIQLNKKQKNYKQALAWSEKLIIVSEQLINNTKIKEIEKLNTLFEIDKKNSKIANQSVIIKNDRILLFCIVIILMLFIAASFLFYKHKKKLTELFQLEQNQKLTRLKMDPHFIFNALSNIQSIILRNNILTAHNYLLYFSKLLRYTLEKSTKDEASLSEVINYLTNYLEMQNLRLNNKLSYSINIDPNLEIDQILIPTMLIQPLIENSIEHGFPSMNSPNIVINIDDKKEYIQFQIIDNGIGLSSTKKLTTKGKESKASQIIKERLDLYSKKLRVKLQFQISDYKNMDNEIAGTIAIITIPILN